MSFADDSDAPTDEEEEEATTTTAAEEEEGAPTAKGAQRNTNKGSSTGEAGATRPAERATRATLEKLIHDVLTFFLVPFFTDQACVRFAVSSRGTYDAVFRAIEKLRASVGNQRPGGVQFWARFQDRGLIPIPTAPATTITTGAEAGAVSTTTTAATQGKDEEGQAQGGGAGRGAQEGTSPESKDPETSPIPEVETNDTEESPTSSAGQKRNRSSSSSSLGPRQNLKKSTHISSLLQPPNGS